MKYPMTNDELKEVFRELKNEAEKEKDYVRAAYIIGICCEIYGPKVIGHYEEYMKEKNLNFVYRYQMTEEVFRDKLGLGFLLDDIYVERLNEILEKEKNGNLTEEESRYKQFYLFSIHLYRSDFGYEKEEEMSDEKIVDMINGILKLDKPFTMEELEEIKKIEELRDPSDPYYKLEEGEAWLNS